MSFVAESAIVLDVPAAEPLVGSWRARHDPVAQRGIPAHVTLLYPFLEPNTLDPDTVHEVHAVLASAGPLDLVLTQVETFPGVVWLRPEPSEPLVELIAMLTSRYPHLIPYGGRHPEPTPHLTVGQEVDPEAFETLAGQVRLDVEPQLPVSFRADHATIYVSRESHQWQRLAQVPLGPGRTVPAP